MARRKKIIWNCGDVFAVPLKNGKYAIGQTLIQNMKNTVGIALYDETVDSTDNIDLESVCKIENLISLVDVTIEQLTYGVWKILGSKKINIPESDFPNAKFRKTKWVGSKMYDAALSEYFLNAYYALQPWDDWFNPNFLDELLVDKSKKPANLILIKNK